MWKYVRYNREIVIAVHIYVVKLTLKTRKVELNSFKITMNSL